MHRRLFFGFLKVLGVPGLRMVKGSVFMSASGFKLLWVSGCPGFVGMQGVTAHSGRTDIPSRHWDFILSFCSSFVRALVQHVGFRIGGEFFLVFFGVLFF